MKIVPTVLYFSNVPLIFLFERATTTNMERRHILIFILSFIILAGAGIVYLFIPKGVNAPFLLPQPQPTPVNPTPTGWKTYENKEFGFAFDYPGDWEVEEQKEGTRTYAIKLWSQDQLIERRSNTYLEPRISAVFLRYDKNMFDEQIQKLKDYLKYAEGNFSVLRLPHGGTFYFLKIPNDQRGEILIGNEWISLAAQLRVPLNMDIVNTFRIIPKE